MRDSVNEQQKARAYWTALLSLLFLLFLAVPAARAQFDTGTITGTLTDNTGAVIGNSTVVVENLGTGKKTTITANSNGSFSASGLPFGNYVVIANAQGFAETRSNTIVLNVGAAVHVALKLN